MNLSQLANNRILDQPVYTPGKPIEKVAEQFGLVSNDIIKLASNENPWGASPHAINIAKQALEKVSLYPDGSGAELIDKLCTKFLLNPKQFILGNGSNEIIELLGHVFIGADDEIIFGQHAFAVYKLVTLLMGGKPVAVEMPGLKHDLGLILQAITAKTKIIFLPSPNNPTGTANSEDEIFSFVKNLPEHVILCLDEAYAEYLENPPDLRHFIKEGKKIICLRTFSKIHGLAGLRIGYGYGSNEMISLLQKARQPCSADNVASVVVELLERPNLNGLFHWAGSEITSRYELGIRILERFGFSSEHITKSSLLNEKNRVGQRPSNLTFELSPLVGKIKTKPGNISEQIENLNVPNDLFSWYRENADDPTKYTIRI
jgi:histidinol-phosphate aminotransferase